MWQKWFGTNFENLRCAQKLKVFQMQLKQISCFCTCKTQNTWSIIVWYLTRYFKWCLSSYHCSMYSWDNHLKTLNFNVGFQEIFANDLTRIWNNIPVYSVLFVDDFTKLSDLLVFHFFFFLTCNRSRFNKCHASKISNGGATKWTA